MKQFLILAVMVMWCSTALAEQRWNPNSGTWETVPDGSNWQSQYNPHDGSWSYQPLGAQTVYNPMQNTWDWNSGNNLNASYQQGQNDLLTNLVAIKIIRERQMRQKCAETQPVRLQLCAGLGIPCPPHECDEYYP